jgi:hypothetical protein
MYDQGKRKSQINFSYKMINIGYICTMLFITLFLLYEWLK